MSGPPPFPIPAAGGGTGRARRRILGWAAAATGAVVLLAMWVIPCRMILGRYGSVYSFAYIYDEAAYADLIQPLIPGTRPGNPFNGFGAPEAYSQHFLEDGLRLGLTALHLDAIEFFWLWRFFFPLLLLLACYLLAREVLRPAKALWRTELAAAAAGAGAAMMACEPLLFRGSYPPEGWVERVPTNIEFLLAILLAALLIRALRNPTAAHFALVACVLAILGYVRPYCAAPWGLATGCGAVALLARREMRPRVALAALAVFILCLVPWAAIYIHNQGVPAQAQVMKRFFGLEPYQVHWRWWLYLLFAAFCAAAAGFMERRDRVFAFSAAFALLAAPFVSGALPIAGELLALDRYSSFYWPVAFAAVLLCLARRNAMWRGWGGWTSACRWMAGLCIAAALLAGAVAIRGARFDLVGTRWPTYRRLVQQGTYIAGYKWIDGHTPLQALFLVDDGFPWTDAKTDFTVGWLATRPIGECDLFSVLARRQRVFTRQLLYYGLLDQELLELGWLHCATFGYPVSEAAYSGLLRQYRPQFIFWHKDDPALRTPPQVLLGLRKIVYSDDYCEVWALKEF